MLQVFAFDQVGVVLSDLYFVDPRPAAGQEGAERGVRLEVRMMNQGELTGSVYSSRPIEVGQPVWRADLLETVDGPPGSLNRAHHHPGFDGWEPGHRVFDQELSSDPVRWVGQQLGDLEGLFRQAGLAAGPQVAADAAQLRSRVPEIERALSALLDGVKAGELGVAPDGAVTAARVSWL
jgi:hypothetical protein